MTRATSRMPQGSCNAENEGGGAEWQQLCRAIWSR